MILKKLSVVTWTLGAAFLGAGVKPKTKPKYPQVSWSAPRSVIFSSPIYLHQEVLLSWWPSGDSVAPTIHLFPLFFANFKVVGLSWVAFSSTSVAISMFILMDAGCSFFDRNQAETFSRFEDLGRVVAVFEFFQHAE